MEYKRCPTCNGSKVVMGGGMIMHDCSTCDGTGKIYDEVYKKAYDDELKRLTIERKRGRPKKE